MRIFTPALAVWLSFIAAAVWLLFSGLEILSFQGPIEVLPLLGVAAILGAVLIILFGLFVRWVIERAMKIFQRARDDAGTVVLFP